MIFYIAMVHISMGCAIMYRASEKVKRWAKWEHFGDDEEEKVENLKLPPPRKGWRRVLCGCKEQFTGSVDAATYIAIRRFYISRNDVNGVRPEEFEFNNKVQDHMNEKFGQILGIEPWMWLTLGTQIVLEGYGWGTWNLFTQLSFGTMIIAGAKLQIVNDELTRSVYLAHDCLNDDEGHGTNSVDPEKLHQMQHSTDHRLLRVHEPDFWFNDPTILETMIKFCLWQNSVSFTLFVYYSVQFEVLHNFHTCFWESRTIIGTIPDLLIILTTVVLSATTVVPVYGVISLAAEHNEKMTKRRMSKIKKHGAHVGELGAAAHVAHHIAEHAHSQQEAHKEEGRSDPTKVVPAESERPHSDLSAWGRE